MAKRRQALKAARVACPAKTKVESPVQAEAERLALELQEARERSAIREQSRQRIG